MEIDYPTIQEPASPQYVCDVLLRMTLLWDDLAEDRLVGSFRDLKIDNWMDWLDYEAIGSLGLTLSELFELSLTQNEWETVMHPAKSLSVWDLCGRLAIHVKQPVVCPSQVLGRTCLAAGAFRTIKSRLHCLGENVNDLAPHSELEPYLIRNHNRIVPFIARLIPTRMPDVQIVRILQSRLLGIWLAGFLISIIAMLAGWNILAASALAISFGSMFCMWLVRDRLPDHVRIGELRTFRDLSYLIANEAPRRTCTVEPLRS